MLARNGQAYPNDSALIELKPSQGLRKEITWEEFDQRANSIANALIDRGIRKDDKVIHWMTNSINWLEAYFGTEQLPIKIDTIKESIRERFPTKVAPVNLKAFDLGYEACRQAIK